MTAIREASERGFDVCLIDTAGRMQNNAPLMQALAKLVSLNRPDRVLFVGEALVGNDGIDQISEFDKVCRAAERHSNAGPGAPMPKTRACVFARSDGWLCCSCRVSFVLRP